MCPEHRTCSQSPFCFVNYLKISTNTYVEGLNVITVLNVIISGPKCNKPPM